MTDQFTSDDPGPSVSIGTPGDLIASVPALLGFTPHDSLVAITQHRREGRGRLGALLRADLPATSTPGAGVSDQLIQALLSRFAAIGPDAVQLLVVTDSGTDHALAHAGLVDAIEDACTAVAIEVSSATWTPAIVPGAPWRCYGPCRCAGILPDPGATELAAHQAVLGKVTYRSRQDAESALAPEPASCSARARQMLDAAHERAQLARALDRRRAVRDDLDAVRVAAGLVGAGQRLDETALARVVVALRDPVVRDVCLGFVLDRDATVRAEHAEQLWWALTRGAPGPEVAEPATLLAFTTVLRGGGALVNVALERARGADPEHRLSRLLGELVDRAVGPATLRRIAAKAADEAADEASLIG